MDMTMQEIDFTMKRLDIMYRSYSAENWPKYSFKLCAGDLIEKYDSKGAQSFSEWEYGMATNLVLMMEERK